MILLGRHQIWLTAELAEMAESLELLISINLLDQEADGFLSNGNYNVRQKREVFHGMAALCEAFHLP